ncbi:hypothetical protein S7711_04437 [Stachybotrys chartarum IBT 7711]|uniref:Major facilitator superfamily (MFS) profile domain-containing protein n=1 Tax=Stachybotrys chartarum (strain CBS 109288 / IBT 7711) TaxID=1280523 RepID=A0A084B5N2_STACB|nr:hypothetical protein S7711_04437 [Stachybotrys chartarum IBT 7711]
MAANTAGVPVSRQDSNEKEALDHLEKTRSASLDNVQQHAYDDPVEARRITRKIDYRLIPMLMAMYTLTFLDRVNIGNARLWNLEEDLGMSGYDYNIVVLVFYIPYIILEIPSNMLLSRVRPRYYLSGLMLGWGLTVTFAGFCTSFAGLLVARIFIGAFEAGMFPGCMYLIGSWYRRHQVLTRMAWFMVANDIAGSVSGLLGAGLGSLDGLAGYSGWSWIFFIEGAMTVTVAAVAYFCLIPFPHDSTFLEPEEKAWVLRRLDEDSQTEGSKHEHMTLKDSLQVLRKWKILFGGYFYLAVCITAYSISVFAPTILRTFGWSSLQSNLLSAPIRIASGIFSVTFGIISDKTKMRGPYCIGGYFVSIVGLFMVMLVQNSSVRYAGLYLTAIGIYICQPLVIAWAVNQVVGSGSRGAVTAFSGGMGQVGGIISALVYPIRDGPMYVPGISTCIAFNAVGIVLAGTMSFGCWWENRQRDMGKRDHLRDLPPDQLAKLGDKHPDFRYIM